MRIDEWQGRSNYVQLHSKLSKCHSLWLVHFPKEKGYDRTDNPKLS